MDIAGVFYKNYKMLKSSQSSLLLQHKSANKARPGGQLRTGSLG